MSIGAMFIELRVFNKKEKKKKKNMGKLLFVILLAWYFSERFGTQLSVDMCCAVKSLKVKIEGKNCISQCMGRIQIP